MTVSSAPLSVEAQLTPHIPSGALAYCVSLWEQYRFQLLLSKKRATKIGDFCFQAGKAFKITINRDLEPFLFLTTYIHEVAHLTVHTQSENRVEAHGLEWKREFQRLLAPVLQEHIYPTDLLIALRSHMTDPMATTYSDRSLMLVFRKYDPKTKVSTMLSEIPRGSIFELRGRWFKKEETKRTRILCQEIKTRKRYLVPADVSVNNIQLSLL